MIRNCALCGKEFDTKSGQKKYCSLECRCKRDGLAVFAKYHLKNPNAQITSKCSGRDIKKLIGLPQTRRVTCRFCGKKFETKSIRKKFCSHNCRQKYYYYKQRNNIKICEICGKEFESTKSTRKYCSAVCERKAKSAQANIRLHKLNPNARHYKIVKSEIGFCKECGREFKIKSLTPEYYCSEECELKSLHRKQNLFKDTTFTWLENLVHQSWSRHNQPVTN